MKILLTGACGYVGSALLPKLRAAGHEVLGLDTQWFRCDGSVYQDDVRTAPLLDEVATCDAVIHLAAISNDPSVSYYPRRSWETGVLTTQQLCQAAAKTGCRIIYASSVSVYGADRGLVTEDMDLHPISDYNKTKMCAERVLLSYPELRPQIIRPATICGLSPRMRLDLTVNMLVCQAFTKGVMTVHGGQQYRPSIHIGDMCDLYLYMLEHPRLVGVWNAGFENHTILELARMVADHTGAEIKITEERDKRSYQVDSSKLMRAGFEPKKTIKDAIREVTTAFATGQLGDEPQHYNLGWMQKIGVQDD